MERPTKRMSVLAALMLVPASLGPVSAEAQGFTYGERLFRENCAVCHGVTGEGDGPVAEFFAQRPRNLAWIAMENDELFPFDEVLQAIDGRREIGAHGNSEMPIWGDLLQADAQASLLPNRETAEEIVQARIIALTYYIQTIQQR